VGARADLREHVTVHRATGEGATTRIGEDVLVMTGAHVSHNAVVGDGAVLTTLVQLGGHVEVGNAAVLGAGVMVHQWVRIGRGAMIGATSALNADVVPFALARGNPARHYRLNTVGLRRRGFPEETMNALQNALRCLRRRDRGGLEALAAAWPEVAELAAFVDASNRGVARFATGG
jgi:UDP-N-acetylglucosamine acyltransferase